MKLIKITKTGKLIRHGTANIQDSACVLSVLEGEKQNIGEAIATEVRKLKKGEEYQLEINGKNSGKVLTRRK